jgi:hypothetical protein
LRSKVKDDVGLRVAHDVLDEVRLPDVDPMVVQAEFQEIPMIGVAGRVERDAGYASTELRQPQNQPASLEAGVPSHEYATPAIGVS